MTDFSCFLNYFFKWMFYRIIKLKNAKIIVVEDIFMKIFHMKYYVAIKGLMLGNFYWCDIYQY